MKIKLKLKMKKVLLLIFICQILYAGDIEGVVYRKANIVDLPKINRYSLRNSAKKEKNNKHNSNLAVIYLTGDGLGKKDRTKEVPKIEQRNLAFEPWLLPVQKGTKVEFPNMDLVFHNVFSYSKAKKFDLGRYGYKQSKPVVFDTPGLVQVFCEIHRTMRAYVLVLDNGYFTTSDKKGDFAIKDVPAGEYILHVWQENMEEYTSKIKVEKDKTVKIEIR